MDKVRHPQYPDLPTTKELGGPELDYSTWWGIFAPAKVSTGVVSTLSNACAQVASSADYRDATKKAKRTVSYLPNAEFKKFFVQQYNTNVELLKAVRGKK